jgi:hypothetical protein
MGLKDWLGKKLEDWREQRHLDQEERERIKKENKKHVAEINDLLDKFTIKQLQNFCSDYIGSFPEDELDNGEDDDYEEDESERIRPEKKKPRFKFPKRTLSWKKDSGARRRRELEEFIWKCIEDGDIRFQQLKDFALNNRVVSPSFFKTASGETGNDSEFHSILDSIEKDFEPEKIKDEIELQGQLAVFLKTLKRKVEREVTIQDSNRLDILIDNVYVLEVKVPRGKTELRNLSAQIEEYKEDYPFLAVVIGDKTKIATDSEDESYDPKFEKNLTVKIKEYADKYKMRYNVRTIIFTIEKRG